MTTNKTAKTKNETTMVKFLWNGIKVGGKLYPAYYSKGGLIDKYPAETIVIYGKRYAPLPEIEGLTIKNESDIRADYFENDRIKVFPTNPHYPAVNSAYEAYEQHRDRIRTRKFN